MAQKIAVFELHGGIGNQLFQLAAADFYAHIWDCKIFFDITHVVNQTNRYSRNEAHKTAFSSLGMEFPYEISRGGRIFLEKVFRRSPPGRKYFSSHVMFPRIFSKSYESGVIGFDKNLQNISPRRFFGYFQTHLYCSESLRQALTTYVISRTEPLWVKTLLNEIQEKRILLMHARFYESEDAGTYLNLGSKYYENAIKFFGGYEQFDDIWLLTNNVESARKEFSTELLANIRILEKPEHVDDLSILHLFISAKELVIANSTFSWWGAYLGDENKIVGAPKFIFNSMPNPEDLYPDEWTQIAP